MLTLPDDSGKTAVIIGLDPGSETLGFGTIEFDIETMQIVKSTAKTFVGSKLMRQKSWEIELNGERFSRINAHKENLKYLFGIHNPLQIACESPFYNPRRPNAYGVLVEVLIAIKQAVYEYSNWRSVFLIDPPTVKKAIGAPGNADKVKMKECILKMTNLCYDGNLEEIDEHSIDALAVAYCRYKELIK